MRKWFQLGVVKSRKTISHYLMHLIFNFHRFMKTVMLKKSN